MTPPLVELDLKQVPLPQRREYWNDFVCASLLLADCREMPDAPLDGSLRVRKLDDFTVCEAAGSGFTLNRNARHVARTEAEQFVLLVQREGTNRVEQGRQRTELQPGAIAIYDGNAASRLAFPQRFRQQVLILPQQPLRELVPALARRRVPLSLPADHASNALVPRLMSALAQLPLDAPQEHITNLRDTLVQTLAAGLAAGTPQPSDPVGALARYHLARLDAYIAQHLHSQGLTVEHMAAALQLSPSQIHRLFQTRSETVMQRVWRQRLHAARAALHDPANARDGVAEIAWRFGFADAAHFSRAFKAAFGCSPRAWRAGGSAGGAAAD